MDIREEVASACDHVLSNEEDINQITGGVSDVWLFRRCILP